MNFAKELFRHYVLKSGRDMNTESNTASETSTTKKNCFQMEIKQKLINFFRN